MALTAAAAPLNLCRVYHIDFVKRTALVWLDCPGAYLRICEVVGITVIVRFLRRTPFTGELHDLIFQVVIDEAAVFYGGLLRVTHIAVATAEVRQAMGANSLPPLRSALVDAPFYGAPATMLVHGVIAIHNAYTGPTWRYVGDDGNFAGEIYYNPLQERRIHSQYWTRHYRVENAIFFHVAVAEGRTRMVLFIKPMTVVEPVSAARRKRRRAPSAAG